MLMELLYIVLETASVNDVSYKSAPQSICILFGSFYFSGL